MNRETQRGSSQVFPLNPAADLADGEKYYIDTGESEVYQRYTPYNWVKVTNNSANRVELYLDGSEVCAVFGRSFVVLSGRRFQSLSLINNSGVTVLKENLQVLIQKQLG